MQALFFFALSRILQLLMKWNFAYFVVAMLAEFPMSKSAPRPSSLISNQFRLLAAFYRRENAYFLINVCQLSSPQRGEVGRGEDRVGFAGSGGGLVKLSPSLTLPLRGRGLVANYL
jgi:hypothetical protein